MLCSDTTLQDGFALKGPLQNWLGLNNDIFPHNKKQTIENVFEMQLYESTISDQMDLHVIMVKCLKYTITKHYHATEKLFLHIERRKDKIYHRQE